MSAQVDPNELRRFAQNLRRFNQELEKQLQVLSGQFAHLGNTWRDQENRKFTEDFEQQVQLIRRCIEMTSDYTPFLLRKADRVEEYLQQR